jgi:pimeloyl-ACP methyl ester carboxylesterase
MRISRRVAVAGLVSHATVTLGAPAPLTFVLVPGAWHGAWAWARVAPLLEKEGHTVAAVSLPGLADRKAGLDDSIHLSSHVDDVVSRVRAATTKVVLVGHSYAGMVVAPAAAAEPSRLARLIFLDAFVPSPGQSMLSLMRQAYSDKWRARAKKDSAGLWVPPMLDAKAMGVVDPKDAAWVDGQLTNHPMATLEEPVQFDEQALAPVPKRYVWCARYPGFKSHAARVKAKGWDVRDLDAGHDAMVTAPSALAALLLAA